MEEMQSNSYSSSKVKDTGEPLEILSSFASDLLIMNNSEDIFEFTAQNLHYIIPDSIIIVSTYDLEDGSLSVYTIRGIHPYITKITSLLGYNPVLSKFKVRDIQDNLLRQPNNTLYEVKGGLPELTFGKITSAQERSMRKILKINSIYRLGLVFGDQIFGSVSILQKKKKLKDKQLAESIIRLSSNALYRVKAQYEFANSQQKLQNIIDKMAEGILHITQGGNILYANKNTCDLVEYTLEELKQMTVYDFAQDKESLKTMSNQIWQQSAEVRNDFHLKIFTRTGKSKWLRVKGNKLTDDAGVENGYLAILSDLAETQKHEAIQKELDIVRGTASLKEQFLSNISHEMITPLNGVSGLTEVLLESNLSDDNKEIATIIHDSSKQLHRIIDEILQFTRIEKGFLKYEPRSFDLSSLLNQNYLLFSASAKQKNIELLLEYQGREDIYLMGDDVKINQVLSNLLGNAIKFTPQKGKIKFTAKLTEQSKEKACLRFDIDDDGIGVDPGKQQSIFEGFEMGDGSMTREHDGLGLGLSISRKLVQIMMGSISYAEKDEPGAHFWFEVPVVVSESNKKKAENKGCIETPDQKMSVMVLENKPIQQKIMEVILRKNSLNICFLERMDDLSAKESKGKEELFFVLFHPRFPGLDLRMIRKFISKKYDKPIPLIAADEKEICLDFIEEQIHLVDDFFPPPYSSEYLRFLIDKYNDVACDCA